MKPEKQPSSGCVLFQGSQRKQGYPPVIKHTHMVSSKLEETGFALDGQGMLGTWHPSVVSYTKVWQPSSKQHLRDAFNSSISCPAQDCAIHGNGPSNTQFTRQTPVSQAEPPKPPCNSSKNLRLVLFFDMRNFPFQGSSSRPCSLDINGSSKGRSPPLFGRAAHFYQGNRSRVSTARLSLCQVGTSN